MHGGLLAPIIDEIYQGNVNIEVTHWNQFSSF